MKINNLFLIFQIFFLCITFTNAQTPAFPTAEGYGKWATGGRGGKVVEVTTLEDDVVGNLVGSFRWALKQHSGQPITIVFRVSGTIDLKGVAIRSKRNNITIAGQTAPGDGICIKGANVNLGGSYNIIVRHIRFRVGSNADGTYIPGAPFNLENGGNFILDHCSFSWSAEEALGMYDDLNQTVQWCMFTEGLYAAGHPKGSRAYGPVVGGVNTSFHHNLIAHTVSRSPRFGCSDAIDNHQFIDFVNNVNYNWGKATACYGGENERNKWGSSRINIQNNYYKPGPAYDGTKKSWITCASWSTLVGTDSLYFTKYFLSGNIMEGSANTAINTNNHNGLDISAYVEAVTAYKVLLRHLISNTPFVVNEPVAMESAQDAYNSVLSKAGAFPRDTVDRRIIREVREGVATHNGSFNNWRLTGIIDNPSQCGGYPILNTYNTITDNDQDGMDDAWEIANGLNPTDREDGNKITLSGYTALEVYLNGLIGENIELKFNTGLDSFYKKNQISYSLSNNIMFLNSDVNIISIKVTDLTGRILLKLQADNIEQIDINRLNVGAYLLKAELLSNGESTIKFIKK
jgi:pectate lyase